MTNIHRIRTNLHGQLLGLLLLFRPIGATAQVPSANPPAQAASQEGMSSVATGVAHAAVFDAQHRPITAGGFVSSGPIVFEDIAGKAGLTIWTHKMGSPAKPAILDSIGSGVALLDYDNDGWLDIYMVNGSTVDALTGKATPPHAALFHNNHDGTFTDVAEKAGVTNDRWGFGAVVGDYDNDGWPDIYVSNYGKNRLYRNNHDGTFTDVTEKAGVALGGWSTGATWGDYDGDGRLDLFVPGYIHMDLVDLQRQESGTSSQCSFRGVKVMCGPRGMEGEADHLFHNNGDGTFTDVSVKAGVADKPGYYGLASVFVDINNNGRPDLLVADDSTPNYLYSNKGNGTFKDDSFSSGYALNEGGSETASMGIAVGDYTHNGRLDIYNTVFSDDYNPLYRNDGDANFTDISYQAGIAEPTIPFLGWGTAFFDYDNDGWLDLFVVNGHVYPQVDKQNFGTTWAQRALLFHNVHGMLHLVPPVEGSGLAKLASARGMAYGDLFNDGKIDVVVNNMDSTPSLFRNVTGTPAAIAAEPTGTPPPIPNHWIAFKLIGGPKSPRDAIGATIYLTANGFRQRADIIAGGSFASSPDQRPHFGLGSTTKIDAIEIRWPDGTRQQLFPPALVDNFYTVTEGKPASSGANIFGGQSKVLEKD
jgi:enediyne biosynthesis protein E4